MNYFAHALPHLGRPYFIAGTALPDWLSVADRRLRLRPRMLEPHVLEPAVLKPLGSEDGAVGGAVHADLASGVLQHLADDDWFHRTRSFVETTSLLGFMFRDLLQGSDGFRCGFLGHIVTEMLLDSVLIEQYPQQFEQYYDELNRIDGARVSAAVQVYAGREPDRLAWFIQLFQREQILRDYGTMPRLWWRLNQVLRRVKLSPLPESAAEWLVGMREIVAQRQFDLLPLEHYPWPDHARNL